jgi:Arc/MetJ-type ribon-helix-helix transcriptional regulator
MAKDKDLSVSAPRQLVDEMEKHLSYGDYKAKWIREAVRQRMSRDDPDARDEPNELTKELDAPEDISVPVSLAFDKRLENHLIYGDSKAEWIREAMRQRLEREPDPEEIEKRPPALT